MQANVGAFDGAFRTLLFIVSLTATILTGQWLWLIPGVVFLLTATAFWCPLYEMFGIQTNQQS